MAVTERLVSNGKVLCTDGRCISVERCRFCVHSRYFVVDNVSQKSPALAFCNRERVTKEAEFMRASKVGCAESRGDGYTSIGNIIS
ncbi:MAG: hypothetical protein Q4Q53_01420 [Methanocorpusculum sp.]|nr:hypothetical protein [Methanocorpusculum sp.]